MGCFLELLRQASAELGFVADTTLFPEGEDGPLAQIRMLPGGQPDPLFQFVPGRHTNRLAYEDRLPPESSLTELAVEASTIITAPEDVADLRALTWEAMRNEMATHRTHMESVNLTRLGKREIEANPDGISLRGPMLEALMAVGMLTREGQADPESSEFQQTADFLRASMDATPAYVVITT